VTSAGTLRVIRYAGSRKDEFGYAVAANDLWPVNYGQGYSSTGDR
jgi:hypothetical protein